MDPHHCGLAPLIWGIFKGPSTGSESQWGNCAAQQIQLQQAVSPRRKIFTIIFCQEVKLLLTIQPKFLDPFVKILGLLVWTRLIFGSIPCNFQKFLNKGKNCPQKNEGYFDQNRPKSAMRVFAKVARPSARIFQYWIRIKIVWGSAFGLGPTIAKQSVENWFPIEIDNLKMPALTAVRCLWYLEGWLLIKILQNITTLSSLSSFFPKTGRRRNCLKVIMDDADFNIIRFALQLC